MRNYRAKSGLSPQLNLENSKMSAIWLTPPAVLVPPSGLGTTLEQAHWAQENRNLRYSNKSKDFLVSIRVASGIGNSWTDQRFMLYTVQS